MDRFWRNLWIDSGEPVERFLENSVGSVGSVGTVLAVLAEPVERVLESSLCRLVRDLWKGSGVEDQQLRDSWESPVRLGSSLGVLERDLELEETVIVEILCSLSTKFTQSKIWWKFG